MTRGFPSRLDIDTVTHTLQRYQARELTRKAAAQVLGISESYFTRLAGRAGVGVHAKPGMSEAVNAKKASAQRMSDQRDQAIIDVIYTGMTVRAAAAKHQTHWNQVQNWVTAYNAELADPTPETERPRETNKRNLKAWAFFAVCRIEARMREEA